METVKKILILYGILLSLQLAGADFWDHRVVNLRGVWKFNIGDDPDWARPDYDDSDWEDIYVPSAWEEEGFHGYDGYAWYRVGFEIRGDVDYSALSIELGYIDDVDEVYINGVLVGFTGGFPPRFYTAYKSFRKYNIPEEVINKGGVNIIAVRVYDTVHGGGIISGSVGIFERENRAEKSMQLGGLWKMREGDEDDWRDPSYDDSNWDPIMVPGYLRNLRGRYYRRSNFVWYRKEFELAEDLKDEEELAVVLGRIDDFDEVYLNGRLIGYTRDDRPLGRSNSWREYRIYVLLDEYLNRDGKNVLAVRVEDIGGNAGIYEGPIGIVPSDEYDRFID